MARTKPPAPSFSELRTKYRLESVTATAKTELEKQLALLSWVHNRWPHAGLSEPGNNQIVVSAVNVMKVEGKPTTVGLDFIPPE